MAFTNKEVPNEGLRKGLIDLLAQQVIGDGTSQPSSPSPSTATVSKPSAFPKQDKASAMPSSVRTAKAKPSLLGGHVQPNSPQVRTNTRRDPSSSQVVPSGRATNPASGQVSGMKVVGKDPSGGEVVLFSPEGEKPDKDGRHQGDGYMYRLKEGTKEGTLYIRRPESYQKMQPAPKDSPTSTGGGARTSMGLSIHRGLAEGP